MNNPLSDYSLLSYYRTAQNFFEILLAIPYSAALQKMSIFENAALVRGSAQV